MSAFTQRTMKADSVKLVSHDDLPSWSIDNEYITRGYRAPGGIVDDIKGRAGGARKSKASPATRAALEGTLYEHSTVVRCWLSIWLYVHNETVNIHTHFWGAVMALTAMALHLLAVFDLAPSFLFPLTHHPIFYPTAILPDPVHRPSSSWLARFTTAPAPVHVPLTLAQLVSTPMTKVAPWLVAHQRTNDWKDVLGFTTYLCGAVVVLSFSATFHTVVCHSREFSHACNKLDYIGIVAMIVGSFLPILHYGFYCHPHLQLFYSLSIVSLGAFATYTVLSRKYATPAYRPIRTSVFLALGLSAVFPVAHICAMYGYRAVSETMALDWVIAGGALYVVGACLYMARIPERFSPGTFDYIGASHQIFHILILLAAFSHYVCIRRAYTFWHTAETIDGRAVCDALEGLRRKRG